VDSSNRLTRYGSFTVNGGVSGAVIVLGNVFSDLSINGGLSGRVAVQGRNEYGLNTQLTTTDQYTNPNARVGILGRVTINGSISSTGALVSGGVIGDDGLEYVPDTAQTSDSGGTTVSVNNNSGIIAGEQDVNGASNVANTAGFFQDVSYAFSNRYDSGLNMAAIDALFTNLGQSLQFNDAFANLGNTTGLALILGDVESLHLGTDGNLTGTVQ
jgi:hypothetical protein